MAGLSCRLFPYRETRGVLKAEWRRREHSIRQILMELIVRQKGNIQKQGTPGPASFCSLQYTHTYRSRMAESSLQDSCKEQDETPASVISYRDMRDGDGSKSQKHMSQLACSVWPSSRNKETLPHHGARGRSSPQSSSPTLQMHCHRCISVCMHTLKHTHIT